MILKYFLEPGAITFWWKPFKTSILVRNFALAKLFRVSLIFGMGYLSAEV
jgi:hypothetical protein